MGDSQGYNGYTNYETWAVCLWLDNEESLHKYSRAIARDAYKQELDPVTQKWPKELQQSIRIVMAADALKDWLGEMRPDIPSSLWSDLLNSAWGRVDWTEVAKTRLED